MRITLSIVLFLSFLASTAFAQIAINGTTITFSDNSMQTTAAPSDHGGTGNTVNGVDSFIGGGNNNLVTDDYGTIGGGQNNQAGDDAGTTSDKQWTTVGGGKDNTASGDYSTVGGGWTSTASGDYSMLGGGWINTAGGNFSTVPGGYSNLASGIRSTVGGGHDNTASGYASTVGGGGILMGGNTASNSGSTVGGGMGNNSSGIASTIPGGYFNSAGGSFSFAAGYSASDGGFGNVFIWGDSGGGTATAANQFNVHASGGILLNGAVLQASDRNMKEAFSFVSARAVLDKVVEMPITKWRFKSEDDSVKHIGPVAQDFMASFGYGSSDKHITATDADGVALAAIQGLNEKLQEQLDNQSNFNTALRWENAALNARLARLERAILRDDE